ncbi:hypothetical protein I6G82_07820 [Lysinibacillus macroides]|uniref:hypothetical protein n=1 Tax=Lysinibacillus macroides TaxID=33935 RepID=UPI00193721BE|nr:hypothetical protein I6G82_07820 [Lysinibacillus macroides]
MKTFGLEWKLIREDALKISLICTIFPILSALLFLDKAILFDSMTLRQAFTMLFGQINQFNVIYWTLLWFGYVILLQILWKPRSKYFLYNMLLRYPTKSWFWLNQLLLILIFTVGYVTLYFVTSFCLFLLFKVHIQFSFLIVLQIVVISLNIYCHALLWKLIELLFSAKIATVLLVIIFYAGVKVPTPYIPFYFGMTEHFSPSILFTVLLTEVLLICMMSICIIRIGLKKDYY